MMKKPGLKEESRKKIDNFWYYYKFHVLAGIFALFVLGVFIKDMVSKVDYDYNIAFVTDYMMMDEDISKLQTYFEAKGEDLNKDGEVHVQIQNYTIPPENAKNYDPQMLAASQTKLTVDMQDGTSMLFFISEENYEKFKDSGVFPANKEDYVMVADCAGFKEAKSPESIKDLMAAVRGIDGSKMAEKKEKVEYREACEKLFKIFVGD